LVQSISHLSCDFISSFDITVYLLQKLLDVLKGTSFNSNIKQSWKKMNCLGLKTEGKIKNDNESDSD